MHNNQLALIGFNDQLVIIVVLALLLFGGRKIPELMRGLGKGLGEFQKGLEEGKAEMARTAAKYKEPAISEKSETTTDVEAIEVETTKTAS
jgi:sec-independent protein translocase protein TatA